MRSGRSDDLPWGRSLVTGRPPWAAGVKAPPIAARPPCQAPQPIHTAAPARAAIQTPSSAFIVRDMAPKMGRAGRLDKPDVQSTPRPTASSRTGGRALLI